MQPGQRKQRQVGASNIATITKASACKTDSSPVAQSLQNKSHARGRGAVSSSASGPSSAGR